jgi:hypothetical protein
MVQRQRKYIELDTGLNYQKDGQWFPSREEIELLASGFAVARQGPHQVIFSPNANSIPTADLLSLDGKRFQSRVLGIACYDSATGASELIGELKDSIGELLPPNRVLYPDAFNGLRASIRLTYTRAGLEQDIILHERPSLPAGFNSLTTRLEVWTEFFDPPVPEKRTQVVRQQIGMPALTDAQLNFGGMRIGQGKAFATDDGPLSSEAVPVFKDWQRIEGRDFLIESVEYSSIEPLLGGLPQAAVKKDRLPAGRKTRAQLVASLAPANTVRQSSERIQMARAGVARETGLVIDYALLNSALTDFTFKGCAIDQRSTQTMCGFADRF